MICGAGFRHTSLSSLPGVSPPASSASSGETLLAANTSFRLSGTLNRIAGRRSHDPTSRILYLLFLDDRPAFCKKGFKALAFLPKTA